MRADNIDNRSFLHRTATSPGLLTIHMADGKYQDRNRRFKPEDPLAASKPVPLVRLFAAQTGRQVLVRSDKPFSALGIAQVYDYRRVLQKLMEQGRLFIRNPFIHQVNTCHLTTWVESMPPSTITQLVFYPSLCFPNLATCHPSRLAYCTSA